VLVVRAKAAPQDELRSALARLGNCQLAAVVINGARPSLPSWLVRLGQALQGEE
jgi:hypothetical protein